MPSFYTDGAPEMDEETSWHLKAFSRLSNSRTVSQKTIQKISLSEMMTYMDMFGFIDTADRFIETIQSLDIAFIEKYWKEVNGG